MKKSMFLVGPLLLVLIGGPVFGWVNADSDGDGIVGLGDLIRMGEGWMLRGIRRPGNLNNDGQTDLKDFDGLSANWGQEVHLIPVGVDLMETSGAQLTQFVSEPIPAGFFGVGSLPWFGIINLQGLPPGTFGAFETGTTDTIVARTEHSMFSTLPDEAEIAVELVEMSLVSVGPIVVNFGGPTELWDLGIQLVPGDPLVDNTGTMSIQRTLTGGTCDMVDVPVELQLIFSRVEPPAVQVMTLGPVLLSGSGNITDVQSSTAGALVVPHLSTSFGIQINLNSPELQIGLVPAQEDLGRPGPIVDPGATIDPNVGSLGRFCVIQAGAEIGAGVVIGEYSEIDTLVLVGSDTLVAQNVVLGAGCNIGSEVMIGARTTVGSNCQFDDGVVISPDCVIGNDVTIMANAQIRNGTFVGNGAIIGQDVIVNDQSNIGFNVIVDDGIFFASGATVADGVTVGEPLLGCSEALSGNFVGTAWECQDAGGVVSCGGEDLYSNESWTSEPQDQTADANTTAPSTDPADGNTPAWVTEAIEDANTVTHHDGVTYGTVTDANIPVSERRYDPNATGYICGDFSHDAERGLEQIPDPADPNKKKYDSATSSATFTVYWKYKPNPAYDAALGDRAGNRKWLSDGSHAVIDIHKDGQTIWIEPQTGKPIDLDFDGDGEVEYWDDPAAHKPFPPPDNVMTDDHVKIEVYPDRKAAEDAGAPIG